MIKNRKRILMGLLVVLITIATTIQTAKYNYFFKIFSIYTIKKESYYITTNFKTAEEKEKWINEMKKRSLVDTNTMVSKDDKILTLSTCKDNDGNRIVVQAKLIRTNEK